MFINSRLLDYGCCFNIIASKFLGVIVFGNRIERMNDNQNCVPENSLFLIVIILTVNTLWFKRLNVQNQDQQDTYVRRNEYVHPGGWLNKFPFYKSAIKAIDSSKEDD